MKKLELSKSHLDLINSCIESALPNTLIEIYNQHTYFLDLMVSPKPGFNLYISALPGKSTIIIRIIKLYLHHDGDDFSVRQSDIFNGPLPEKNDLIFILTNYLHMGASNHTQNTNI